MTTQFLDTCKALFIRADADGNGTIDIDEFKAVRGTFRKRRMYRVKQHELGFPFCFALPFHSGTDRQTDK